MSTNTPLTDLNIEHSTRPDDRRMEVLVNGLTLWGGTPLAKNTALVSALTRDGQPRRRAGRFARGSVAGRKEGGRNGPARNSSGAIAADPWCSELKPGGRWSQKTSTFVTRLAQPPPLLQTSLAAALISRGTALLSHAGRHARLRGQLARPRLFQPQERGRKRTLPRPGAPRHLSTPPIGPTEPKQPGNRPVQQSYCSESCGEKTKTRKKHRQKQNQEIPTIVGLQHRPPNPHKFLSRH